MSDLKKQLKDAFEQSGLKGRELKQAIRDAVKDNWPDLPPWTTLDGAVVNEVQTATAGSGVVLAFTDSDGTRKAVLAEAGDHYKNGAGNYMIPGGFINLSSTPGSSLVPASSAPEDGRTGAAREVEEELKTPTGAPLLQVDPARLKPMDTKTLLIRGETRIVMGFLLELNEVEVLRVKSHVAQLALAPDYQDATAQQSMNHESGKPEVSNVAIKPLADVASGKVPLLHKDQQSLFQEVEAHYKSIDAAVKRGRNNFPSIH